MKIALNEDLCFNKDSCGMRLGILAINGKIISDHSNIMGTANSRNIFFPNDT